jgi:hypothetical protein
MLHRLWWERWKTLLVRGISRRRVTVKLYEHALHVQIHAYIQYSTVWLASRATYLIALVHSTHPKVEYTLSSGEILPVLHCSLILIHTLRGNKLLNQYFWKKKSNVKQSHLEAGNLDLDILLWCFMCYFLPFERIKGWQVMSRPVGSS